jgi:ketosteroid isomerase-like protein
MRMQIIVAALGVALVTGCTTVTTRPSNADLQRQVADTERAFAKTMADRNPTAFASFLADDAIFFTSTKALRGKSAVVDAWKRFYESPTAPFSWQPETVEVLDSGNLALSSGPVRDPDGKLAATFTSIWRLEAPGTWRIIFDKGNEVCDCPKP